MITNRAKEEMTNIITYQLLIHQKSPLNEVEAVNTFIAFSFVNLTTYKLPVNKDTQYNITQGNLDLEL